MDKVISGRHRRPKQPSKGLNFTKFLLVVIFILLLIGIGFLSVIMRDAESYTYGFLIGFGYFVLMYLLFRYAPDYYLKREDN